MSRFGRLLAAMDQGGKPPSVHVPSAYEMKHISTATLRLMLAEAFATANVVAEGRQGHARTMADLHIRNAQAILRKASRDALAELEQAVLPVRMEKGADWSRDYAAPRGGPPRPCDPDDSYETPRA